MVDFPAPLGPKKPTISGLLTLKEILFKAFWVPYIFETPSTSIDIIKIIYSKIID